MVHPGQNEVEFLEGRNDQTANLFETLLEPLQAFTILFGFRQILERDRFPPHSTLPPTGQGLVFEEVDILLLGRNQTTLERSKPVSMLPSKGGGTHRTTGQLRQRVVGHRLAAVEKEG